MEKNNGFSSQVLSIIIYFLCFLWFSEAKPVSAMPPVPDAEEAESIIPYNYPPNLFHRLCSSVLFRRSLPLSVLARAITVADLVRVVPDILLEKPENPSQVWSEVQFDMLASSNERIGNMTDADVEALLEFIRDPLFARYPNWTLRVLKRRFSHQFIRNGRMVAMEFQNIIAMRYQSDETQANRASEVESNLKFALYLLDDWDRNHGTRHAVEVGLSLLETVRPSFGLTETIYSSGAFQRVNRELFSQMALIILRYNDPNLSARFFQSVISSQSSIGFAALYEADILFYRLLQQLNSSASSQLDPDVFFKFAHKFFSYRHHHAWIMAEDRRASAARLAKAIADWFKSRERGATEHAWRMFIQYRVNEDLLATESEE